MRRLSDGSRVQDEKGIKSDKLKGPVSWENAGTEQDWGWNK